MTSAIATTDKLSVSEKAKLKVIVKRITTTAETILEDLKVIRDERLYREHGTFEDFCGTLELSSRRAQQLIASITTKGNLMLEAPANGANANASSHSPQEEGELTEAQLRPLAGLPPVIAKAALAKAKAGTNGKPPSSRQIASAVKTLVKPAKPKSGSQKRDPRRWNEIENHLGKGLRMVDALHNEFPSFKHHAACIALIGKAMDNLKEWKGVHQ